MELVCDEDFESVENRVEKADPAEPLFTFQ